MALFLLIFIIAILFLIKKSHYRLLCEPLFWIGVFWTLIVGVYLTAGIDYKYGLSIQTCLFLYACTFALVFGRKIALRLPTKIFEASNAHIKEKKYIVMGVIGVVAFTLDYIRLNGLASSKGSSDISIIGSLGSLFVPILLLMGLYRNADSIKNKGRFDILGIILVFGYSIPCMINAGREAILFGLIGIICLFAYGKMPILNNNTYISQRQNGGMKNVLFFSVAATSVLLLGYTIIQISASRFTENEINTLLTYRDVSNNTMNEASKWGAFEFLYYNIASYFSHQIPFIDFTLQEYDGPYLCGMYEFNIISRRLPDFLGLDYMLASAKLNRLYSYCGESFYGAWNTVLGSFIIDFTWIGSIIACWVCGFGLGKFKKKFDATLDVRYITIISLLCLSSFSTIQLGPFYQTQIYGAYIWWYLIFRKDEKMFLK